MFYYIYILLILLFGINVLSKFGIDHNTFYAVFLFIGLLFILKNIKKLLRQKELLYLLVFILCFSLFKLFFDTSPGNRFDNLSIIGAPIIIASLPGHENNYGSKVWKLIGKAIIFFVTIEVSIAIIERILQIHIFPWRPPSEYSYLIEVSDFRSNALHGHPLQNSLIVSIIMSFILIAPIRLRYKIIIWFVCYLSVLCFNTRAAMVGDFCVFIIYIGHLLASKGQINERTKCLLWIILFSVIGGIVFFMLRYNLGARLLNLGLLDESSAYARVNTFSIFNYFNWTDFIFGLNYKEITNIMSVAGISVTENFWIDWLLRFGLIFLLPFIILYFRYLKKIYENYDKFSRTITLFTFILIASTNNSLSSSFMPLLIFLLCVKIFDPKYIRQVFPLKYLTKL